MLYLTEVFCFTLRLEGLILSGTRIDFVKDFDFILMMYQIHFIQRLSKGFFGDVFLELTC